jgi:hypothetical protein
MNEIISQAIIEALQNRASEHGDYFQLNSNPIQVRCFDPEKHKNADDHPSAYYYPGKYIICKVCGFKASENKLADRLGIGVVEGGLTLSILAAFKKLPVDFLQNWGWRTQKGFDGKANVLIPWYDQKGVSKTAPAYHIRHYINKDDDRGPRFTWDLPKSTKLNPYGIWRFHEYEMEASQLKIESYIFLVESELDAVTCWLHQIPAAASGGADHWKLEWADHFRGFNKIIIAQEPGAGGINMVKLIARDLLKYLNVNKDQCQQLLVCPFPEESKDMNALHLKVNGNKQDFRSNLFQLMSQAVPAEQILNKILQTNESIEQEQKAQEQKQIIESIRPLLEDPALLHKAIHKVEELGLVGERKNIGLLHLQVRSRALPRPINIEINSPSSSGKTYLVLKTHELEHPQACYEITASSEKALIFSKESFQNRIIYIQEPEGFGNDVSSAIMKSSVWEGRVKYDTVVSDKDGNLVGNRVEKNGPCGLVATTTIPLEEQLSNRMLRIEVDTTEEQTRNILNAIADAANEINKTIDLKPWHALSLLLGEPTRVKIPFGRTLADKVSTKSLRIRRDFTHLLSLIAACAVEYSFQRSKSPEGSILATVADYAMVYSLFADTFQNAQAEGINENDRKMVDILLTLSKPRDGSSILTTISQADLRNYMQLSKSTASYRVKRLLRLGYIINLESDKDKPMKLVPGSRLPDKPEPLPDPCTLSQHLLNTNLPELIIPWVNPISGEVHDCRKHIDNSSFTGLPLPLAMNPEPCPLCRRVSRLDLDGFKADEPLEPDLTQNQPGFNKVQSKLNPPLNMNNLKPNPGLGSGFNPDIPVGLNLPTDPKQNNDYGEL